jgi:hypothetical protein
MKISRECALLQCIATKRDRTPSAERKMIRFRFSARPGPRPYFENITLPVHYIIIVIFLFFFQTDRHHVQGWGSVVGELRIRLFQEATY